MSYLRLTFILSPFLWMAGATEADDSSVHTDGLRRNVPNVWALQHADVVVRPGTTIQDATIIIRKGKVESVVAGGPVPTDARAVDLSGKTVYPGFIDAYSETEIPGYQLKQTAGYWNPNVLSHLSVAKRLTENEDAEKLRTQGFVAQLRAPGNGVIRGQSALVSTGTDDPNVAVLAENVAQHMQLTINSRGREQYPGSPMGAVALARQAMYDAAWYHDAWNAVATDSELPRPERNVALAALGSLKQGQPLIVECTNELFVLRADRFASEFGLNLIVRGSGHEYRRLNDIAATKRTLILPVNFPQPPNVSTPEVADNVTLESLLHWDLAPENPLRVHNAGLAFAFTTDGLKSVDEFLAGVRKAVQRGLSAEVALAALTETPASLFGVDDQLGSITRGKLASFVVTDGDLFDKKSKVVETWIAGARFQHSPEPHRKLEGVYRIQLTSGGKQPRQLFVELTRGDKSASGRISTKPLPPKTKQKNDKDKTAADDKIDKADSTEQDKPKDSQSTPLVDLKNVLLRDFAATGQFKSDDFGDAGVARISLLFSEPDVAAGKSVGAGQVVWPSGNMIVASVFIADSVAQDSPADEQENANDDKSDRDSKENVAASFAVNFPLGAFGRETADSVAMTVAVVNATIWTCGPMGVIENGTLLIKDGRIVSVGENLPVPQGVTRIDGKGMHVTPGIIDCHSHMATDGGVNESTQAITCEVRIGDFIDCDDITIYRQLAGGVTSSNILHGSANPIGGQNQVIKLRWGANDEAMKFAEAPPGVKFALGENVKQSNWGDEYNTRYPQTRMGVEQIFRDAFAAATEYGQRMEAWKRNQRGLPPRRDLELDALLEIVQGTRWIHCHSYRQDEILALIRVLEEHDITIGTFQHILEGYKVADAMAQHGAMGSAFSDWWAYKFEVFDAIPFGGALMHDAGVVVSFNSDDAELGTRLNQEAAKAVKYGGVSEVEALKFVTLNPARQLRIDQYVGSLEVGKHADFLVWNGAPLSGFSRCEQTWIDGVRYFDRKADAAARTKNDEMRNTLIQKILASGEKMRGVGDDEKDDPSALWPRHDEYCHQTQDGHVHARANE
ncbi:MAG: amidohydrolase family protein [Planctomycetaceae bacterium]